MDIDETESTEKLGDSRAVQGARQVTTAGLGTPLRGRELLSLDTIAFGLIVAETTKEVRLNLESQLVQDPFLTLEIVFVALVCL